MMIIFNKTWLVKTLNRMEIGLPCNGRIEALGWLDTKRYLISCQNV
jgi:hypothetical protein